MPSYGRNLIYREGRHQSFLTWTSKMGLVLCSLCAYFTCVTLATMDITAFEYNRKFHKTLELGQCCQSEQSVNMGNNSYYIEQQKCSLQQRGTVTYTSQEVNDVKNILITSPDLVVPSLGLCGGEAASFLGILNTGDCVAVEIASRLTFNDKTIVRAFVGNYQKCHDSLDEVRSNSEGVERYLKDKFYLQKRSYGSLELLLVQFRFESVLAAQEAKKIKIPTLHMSGYMNQIMSKVGLPKGVVVINLSTANHETYQFQQFKREDWYRAVRHVEVLELGIQRTVEQINTNSKKYHLTYRLHPFMEDKDYRFSSPSHWEEISNLEVLIRQAMSLAKKTSQKCRGYKTKLCHRVRELKRKLTSAQTEVHKGRANWIRMKPEDKSVLATYYTANVQSYSSVSRNLAKSVKEMKKKGKKLQKTEKQPDKFNQIPRYPEESIQKRQRRFRAAGSRNRLSSAPE